MKQLDRIYPYNLRVVKAVVLDVADSLSHDAARDRKTGQICATVNVFDNESRVSFEVSAVDSGRTRVCITLISTPALLSEDGQTRTLNYLADSMEQLIENAFIDERPPRGPNTACSSAELN